MEGGRLALRVRLIGPAVRAIGLSGIRPVTDEPIPTLG